MEGGLTREFPENIRKVLFDVVEDLLKTDNFKVRIEPGSKKGDNFLGIVYRIICYTADEKRSSYLFLKYAPENDCQRKQLSIHSCFAREIYVYNTILPAFRQFEESRKINVIRDGFNEYSRCYKSVDIAPVECLFLQDLTERKYSMINKNNLTVDNILMVMKTIGKFHAVSLAMKDQQPEKFSQLVNKLDETLFKSGRNATLSMDINKAALNMIDAITDEKDAHLMEVLLKLYEQNQYDIVLGCIDGNAAEPYTAIIHGDLWSNNTMFRLINKPHRVRLIDWQLCRYASPVLDVLYYIFCSTTRELRGRNYSVYLKTYYESLSNHLIRLGSDPENVFPYSAMMEHLQKFGKYGLVQASFAIPFIEAEANVENVGTNVPPRGLSKNLKKRLRDIVADMERLGYI